MLLYYPYINVQLRGHYDQLFVFNNSKTHGTIVYSKNIRPHFIGKKGKHSTFDEYIVNFSIPTPISDGVYARVSFSHGFVVSVLLHGVVCTTVLLLIHFDCSFWRAVVTPGVNFFMYRQHRMLPHNRWTIVL